MPSGIRGFIVLTNAEYLERGEYMRKYKLLDLLDIHWLLIITISTIAVLLFGVFNWVGLVLYGVLLVYNGSGIVYNFLNGRKISKNITFFSGVLFSLYFLLASFINGNSSDWATIIQYGLILVLVSFAREGKEIQSVFLPISKVLTISGICMAFLSILIPIIGNVFPSFFLSLPKYDLFIRLNKMVCDIKTDRLIGFGLNPITTSFYCYATIAFSVFLFSITGKQLWKILSAINIGISSFFIAFLARSRTYMLALFAFYGAYFFIYYCVLYRDVPSKQRDFKVLLFVFCSCFIVFVLLFTLFDSFRSFILEDVFRVQNIDTFGNRGDIFTRSLIAGEGHRLFGISSMYFEQIIEDHTHNVFLEVLTFGGVPSLFFFMIYVFSSIYISIKNMINKNEMPINIQIINCLAFAYIVSYLVGGISEPGGVRTMRLAFAVLQLMIGSVVVIYVSTHTRKHDIVSK